MEQVNNMPGHRNPPPPPEKEQVNHPQHYGGQDNPYEAIKVIDAWDLNFNLGNTIKYIARCGRKDDEIQELEKVVWYLNNEIKKRKSRNG